mgnify:CR=1 FL=1
MNFDNISLENMVAIKNSKVLQLSEEEINIVRSCSQKETEKQFREIDNKKLISKIIKSSNINKTNIIDY